MKRKGRDGCTRRREKHRGSVIEHYTDILELVQGLEVTNG